MVRLCSLWVISFLYIITASSRFPCLEQVCLWVINQFHFGSGRLNTHELLFGMASSSTLLWCSFFYVLTYLEKLSPHLWTTKLIWRICMSANDCPRLIPAVVSLYIHFKSCESMQIFVFFFRPNRFLLGQLLQATRLWKRVFSFSLLLTLIPFSHKLWQLH